MAFELAELGTQASIARFRELRAVYDTVIQQNLAAIQLTHTVQAQIRRDQLQAQQQQAATEQGRTQQTLAASEAVSRIRQDCIRCMAAIAEFTGDPTMAITEAVTGQGVGQGATATNFGSSIFR
jgi:hypothetical protein